MSESRRRLFGDWGQRTTVSGSDRSLDKYIPETRGELGPVLVLHSCYLTCIYKRISGGGKMRVEELRKLLCVYVCMCGLLVNETN